MLSRNEGMNHFIFGRVKKVLKDIQVTWPLISSFNMLTPREMEIQSLHQHTPFPIKTGMWDVKHWWTFCGFTWSVPRNSERSKCEDTHQVYSPRSFHAPTWFLQLQADSLPSKVHLIWWDGAKFQRPQRKHMFLHVSSLICHIFQWSPRWYIMHYLII